jgi:NAD(P)H-nitrite reductase large subunit
MKGFKYLIVGASAAGMAAAHTIRQCDQEGSIGIFTDEIDPPYFRPLIPFLISGKKKASDMFMDGTGPYVEKDIVINSGNQVTTLNINEKKIGLSNCASVSWNKILLATGSRPFMPKKIEGLNTQGVFALRSLSDARQMAKMVDQSKHAIMLGGGILNLKTAFALLEKGLKVTLIVYSPEVLSQLMEPDDASLIRKALNEVGLKIITGVNATAIHSEKGKVKGILLDNGVDLPCEMVCVGKGVKPNVEFLENTQLTLNEGIVADIYTACNIPDVYTAGDVAVTFDPVTGASMKTALWTNAVEMGRCAGKNMAGIKTAYSGTLGILNATQVANVPFVSMGTVHTDQTDFQVFRHRTDKSYRKLVFRADGNQLLGAVFVGNIQNAGLYRYVIREKMKIDHIKSYIIDHQLHYGHFGMRKK